MTFNIFLLLFLHVWVSNFHTVYNYVKQCCLFSKVESHKIDLGLELVWNFKKVQKYLQHKFFLFILCVCTKWCPQHWLSNTDNVWKLLKMLGVWSTKTSVKIESLKVNKHAHINSVYIFFIFTKWQNCFHSKN